MNTLTKQPSESFYIEANFENLLETAEVIVLVNSSVTAVDFNDTDATATVLNAGTLDITTDSKSLIVQIKGGVVGNSPYTITFVAKTSDSNVFEIDIFLYIRETVPAVEVGMTLAEMMSMFRFYIDDTKKNDFSPDLIVRILNNNQNRVLSILKRHIFTELDASDLSKTLDSDGAFDLLNLSKPIYNNDRGIDLLQITGGKPCDKISLDEYREFVRVGKIFTSDKAIYYMRGSKAYIKPISTKIDLYYMRAPTKMVVDADPDNNVNCELSYDVQMIILGLSVQNYVDKFPECARVYNEAMISIGQLNEKPLSDSTKFARYYGDLSMGTGKRFNILTFE